MRSEKKSNKAGGNAEPQIVRCEVTGESWQVAYWPDGARDAGRMPTVRIVLLKRGRLEREEPVNGFFENYAVVC